MDTSSIVITLYYLFISALIVVILLENRNPTKTAAYILILVFIPVIGLLIYTFFGRDYRKQKIFSLKGYNDNQRITDWQNQNLHLFEPYKTKSEDLISDILTNGSGFTTINNQVDVIFNGENKFPLLFKAIDEAKHHIHLEYYIIQHDELSFKLLNHLAKKVEEGVKVRLVYDDVGSRLKQKAILEFKNKGIEIEPYMPVKFPYFTSKANYRDHRKIAIIDGEIGFLGGINISNRYINTSDKKQIWRDTHLQLRGESVRQLQLQFMLMWKFVSGETLPVNTLYFPEIPHYNPMPMQIVVSGPDSSYPNIMLAYFTYITRAKKSVYITTPYFIPNEQINTAILAAALNGVSVKLVIPKNSDSKITQAASMSYLRVLLKAGVEVYLYNKGFIHAKSIVIDGTHCSVGTANMDVRSFYINFEINAFMACKTTSDKLTQQFFDDVKNSDRLLLSRWEKRPLTKKVQESIARLLAPLL